MGRYNEQQHRQDWIQAFETEFIRLKPEYAKKKPKDFWHMTKFYYNLRTPAKEAAKKYAARC